MNYVQKYIKAIHKETSMSFSRPMLKGSGLHEDLTLNKEHTFFFVFLNFTS